MKNSYRKKFMVFTVLLAVMFMTILSAYGNILECMDCDTVPLPNGSPTSCQQSCQNTRYVNAEKLCTFSWWDAIINCQYTTSVLYMQTVEYEYWASAGVSRYMCYIEGNVVAFFSSTAAAAEAGFSSGCQWETTQECVCLNEEVQTSSNTTQCIEL